MMNLHSVQTWFTSAVARKELRPIDIELPRVLHKLAVEENALCWLLCALVSHQYGRGHSCMRLSELVQAPEYVLGFALPNELRAVLVETDLHTALQQCAWVQCIEQPEAPIEKPLVYFSGALYLARLWKAEHSVAQAIHTRIGASSSLRTADSDLPALIQRVFGEQSTTGIDWQALACAMAAQRKFAIITGGPGTGKTTTVVRLLAILRQKHGDNLRILLAAPTGKAAARLTESIAGAIDRLPASMQTGIPTDVTTLHKMLGARPFRRSFKHSAQHPLAADVVVVDEASMVDLEMMAALMNALPEHAQLVLLGDKDQLASVEAGSVLGDLCKGAEAGNYNAATLSMLQTYTAHDLSAYADSSVPDVSKVYNQATVMLRESHRFGAESGIGNLARAVNAGDIYRTLPKTPRSDTAYTAESIFTAFDDLNLLAPEQSGTIYPTEFAELRKLVIAGYQTYLQVVAKGEASGELDNTLSARDNWAKEVLKTHRSFQLLVALRKGMWGVQGLNDTVSEWLQSAGLIARAVSGTRTWYAGRPVLVQRNNYTLNLMNGDIGITLPDPETGKLRVVFEQADGNIKWVLPSRLSDVETVFALTVHKSQGSEFTHTVLVLPDELNPVLTRELVYTGITRASKQFTLVAAKPSVFVDAVQQRVIRSSGL